LLLIMSSSSSSSSSRMKLYAYDISNYCSSVRIALAYKQLDYQVIPPPDGYGSIAYKKIVPMGTIPALIIESANDNDNNDNNDNNNNTNIVISESQVILEYLDQKYPNTKPIFISSDADKNAQLRFIHRLHDLYLEPSIRALFKHMDPNIRCNDIVKEKFENFNNRLMQLEDIVSDYGPYIMGDVFTVSECILPPTLLMTNMMAHELGEEVKYQPKLLKWWTNIQIHPQVSPILDKARIATKEWIDRKKLGAISKCSL